LFWRQIVTRLLQFAAKTFNNSYYQVLFTKLVKEGKPVNQYVTIGKIARCCWIPFILILYKPDIRHKVNIFCRAEIKAGSYKMFFGKGAVSCKVGVSGVNIGSVEVIIRVIAVITCKKAQFILINSAVGLQ
jgi:hypothetical protein